jgi:uncharacterized membrane protein YeaQ/YmgE (transglycosylase-associated protein family)
MNSVMKWVSRKFLLSLGCGAVTSSLCYLGKIDGAVYATVVLGTVGAYIAGNVAQKGKGDAGA